MQHNPFNSLPPPRATRGLVYNTLSLISRPAVAPGEESHSAKRKTHSKARMKLRWRKTRSHLTSLPSVSLPLARVPPFNTTTSTSTHIRCPGVRSIPEPYGSVPHAPTLSHTFYLHSTAAHSVHQGVLSQSIQNNPAPVCSNIHTKSVSPPLQKSRGVLGGCFPTPSPACRDTQ